MTIRVGLIGCGFIGRFHSAGIRAIKRRELLDLEYAVVCDEEESRARSFAQIAGVADVTADSAAVIDSPDVDVVYICVPTAGHKELVLRAAERGKHIFCEKPLATNLADVEEMVSAVDRAGVKAGVGLVLRHSPILTVLKSLADDPTLGRLMAVVFRDDQFFPVEGYYRSTWRKDREVVGSGTLLEHSIHDIDVLRWIGGNVRSARGAIRNFAGHEGVEDLATAHLEFAESGLAELVSIWHSVIGRPSTRRLEIFYEKGVFHVDHDFMGPIHYQTHATNQRVLSEEEVRNAYLQSIGLTDSVFQDLLRYSLEDYFFLRAVAGDKEPFPNFHLALEAHQVVDAIYRSAAAGGQPIDL